MKTQRYIDLHTHTFYSDGIGTPELNVRTARIEGIEVLAIADHDKINGYVEARRAGEIWQVQIVPGVEISTDRYHILGLGIDVSNKNLVEFLDYSAEEQRKVCEKRVEFLRSRKIPITLEKVLRAYPNSRLGKMNLYYVMAQDRECQEFFGVVSDRPLTLRQYRNILKGDKGKEEVVDKMTGITPQETIRHIHDAGGIAIIAHPFKEIKDMAEMDVLLSQGLDGLEVQPQYNGQNDSFMDYAKQHNLLVTYGSDYHGGLFGRQMLDNKGENILSEELANALRLGVN